MKNMPKLGIIAGGGVGPFQLAKACLDTDRPFHLVLLKGHAEQNLETLGPHTWLGLGELGKFRDLCCTACVQEIVMIGRVRRPSLLELKPDLLTLKLLSRIGLHLHGDDGLLRAIGKVLETECKVKLVGASDILGDLLTTEGAATRAHPNDQAQEDIARAVEVARALGQLDVGQAVIVQQGLVLGVEALEGTDALIERSHDIRREGQGGVLVKLAKPQQDARLDLPSIGPETVQKAYQAGLCGIALEAGRSLILDREKTLEAADLVGLFIVGLALDKTDQPHE